MSNATLTKPRIAAVEPALLRRPDAARMMGMGQSTLDRHDAAGLVPEAKKIGGVKAWSVLEIRAWIEAGCPDRAKWVPLWAEMQRRNARS